MLNEKQQRFVEEYLVDLNATQAAIRAGYAEPSARQMASRLLSKANVQEAIAVARKAQTQRTNERADRVIQELSRIAYADPRKLFHPDGTLKAIPDLDDDAAATVAQLEVFEEYEGAGKGRRAVGQTRKLKQWDKVAALVNLGKHFKLFNSLDGDDLAGAVVITGIEVVRNRPKHGDKPE